MSMLWELYHYWNQRINVISRKDINHLYEHHVLHSLSLLRVVRFFPGSRILDVGTGGGFPGVPLAIVYPECKFILIDGIQKKIRVVHEVIKALGLKNIHAQPVRVEHLHTTFEYIVSRAVTSLPEFYRQVAKNLKPLKGSYSQGIYYLKGGDLQEEITDMPEHTRVYDISDFFDEAFFGTKKIVYIPT